MKIRNVVLGEGMPLICVPLMAKNRDQLILEARRAREAGADLVEFRFDAFEDKEEAHLLDALLCLRQEMGEVPVLFTIRTLQEGGSLYDCPPALYEKLNLLAAQSGRVDLVDIEALGREEGRLVEHLKQLGVKVVASSHDFQETKPNPLLRERFEALRQSGAQILKMAVMPREREDVQRFMGLVKEIREEVGQPVIAMSMGELGRESRILGETYGSCVTFGTTGEASAPGQIPVEELKKALEEVHRGEKR